MKSQSAIVTEFSRVFANIRLGAVRAALGNVYPDPGWASCPTKGMMAAYYSSIARRKPEAIDLHLARAQAMALERGDPRWRSAPASTTQRGDLQVMHVRVYVYEQVGTRHKMLAHHGEREPLDVLVFDIEASEERYPRRTHVRVEFYDQVVGARTRRVVTSIRPVSKGEGT